MKVTVTPAGCVTARCTACETVVLQQKTNPVIAATIRLALESHNEILEPLSLLCGDCTEILATLNTTAGVPLPSEN